MMANNYYPFTYTILCPECKVIDSYFGNYVQGYQHRCSICGFTAKLKIKENGGHEWE